MHFGKWKNSAFLSLSVVVFSMLSGIGCHRAASVRSAGEDIVPAGTIPVKSDTLQVRRDRAADVRSELGGDGGYVKSVSELVQQSGRTQEAIKRLQTDSDLSSDEKKMLAEYLLQEFNDTLEFLISFVSRHGNSILNDNRFQPDLNALIRWIPENLARFTIEQQNRAMTVLYWADRALIERGVLGYAWKGFDHFSFGLRQFDEWVKAGRPIRDYDIEPAQVFIVCPRVPIEKSGTVSIWHGRHCSDEWYMLAMSSAENRKRLAAFLAERNDPILTAVVFLNLVNFSQDALLEVAGGLEESLIIWDAAWRVLARFVFDGSDKNVPVDKMASIWHEHPSLRPGILRCLAYWEYSGILDSGIWRDFQGKFGELVSKDTYKAFMNLPSIHLTSASRVWPALSKGWSRIALMTPILDKMFSANPPAVGAQSAAGNTMDDLYAVIDQICLSKEFSELDALRNYLRTQNTTGHDIDLNNLIQYASKSKCGPYHPHKKQPKTDIDVGYHGMDVEVNDMESEKSETSAKSRDQKLRIIQTEDE